MKKCKMHGISLNQALSLRRHHMKLLNPNKQMRDLDLGSNDDILAAALLFEESVGNYLRECRIPFVTEKQQRNKFVSNPKFYQNGPCHKFLVIQEVLNPKLEIEGLLRTMYDPRNSLTNDVSKQLTEYFGDKVYRTVIPRNVRLAEAPSHGMPVMAYDKQSKGALSYLALAGEILRRADTPQ